MSSIEKDTAQQAAGELFDECVVAIADSRGNAGQQAYFPRAGEPGAVTYFEEPLLRVMRPSDFEFPGAGTAEGLLDALAAAWTEEGETYLVAMAPRFKEIAEALREEASEGDGSTSILCYTMF